MVVRCTPPSLPPSLHYLVPAWYAFPDYKMTDECSLMVARRDIEPGEEITFGVCES